MTGADIRSRLSFPDSPGSPFRWRCVVRAEQPDNGTGAALSSPFAALPSVTAVADAAIRRGASARGEALTRIIARELARERDAIAGGVAGDREEITERVVLAVLAFEVPRLRPLLNGTGVVIHTNLGRAPVSAETAAAMADAAANAVALELDPLTNARGGRMSEIRALLASLTGAESVLVVNNCAAAVLLTLSALASGRAVAVSRGEAVEIGGGFRIPDVMRQSGAALAEVGTTNRTYAEDYERAPGDVAAFLKVHLSNFKVSGFTHVPSVVDLATAARRRGVPLLEDLGSGALIDTALFGLDPEPTVRHSIEQGVDVVMFSGDKLLGGPQAGVIAGRADLIALIERHPLARAVRADKTTLAGIAATLRHYLRGEAVEKIPVWRMISAEPSALRVRAERLCAELGRDGIALGIAEVQSTVGGGTLPGETQPSVAVELASGPGIDQLAARLRVGTPGVFGRIEQDRLVVDLRTILPEQDVALADALRTTLGSTTA